MRIDFLGSRIGQTAQQVGKDGRAQRQRVAAGQGFGHWHAFDQALIRLGTTNKFVVPVEQEGFVLSLAETRFPSTGKRDDKGVAIKEVLV